MTREEFSSILDDLDLTQGELSSYMEVNIRTVRRWFRDPSKMNEAAKQVILAWHKISKLCLPWRPDSIDLLDILPNSEEPYRKIQELRLNFLRKINDNKN